MACFCITEEEQQAAQTLDSREMATSSTDRTAQTPPIIHLKNVTHSSKNTRGYIIQSEHTVA